MNIQSHTHNFFPKALHVGVRQNVRRQKGMELPGGVLLWATVVKVLLIIMPLTLAGNLWVTSAMNSVETRIQAEQHAISQANSENIIIRANKAQLVSPEHMRIIAAEKLALMVPEPGQIQRM